MTHILKQKMIEYYRADPKRINHFMKVYAFAQLIGQLENLPDDTQRILEIAAIVHDIGIKASEEKYGSSCGRYQEKEGPALTKNLLEKLGFSPEIINRVCYLVGHHHTYKNIDGLDYQILVEADFIVNIYEDNMNDNQIVSIKNNVFKTQSGIAVLNSMFNLNNDLQN